MDVDLSNPDPSQLANLSTNTAPLGFEQDPFVLANGLTQDWSFGNSSFGNGSG
jgi:hypothetical protein